MAVNAKFTASDLGSRFLPALVVCAALVALAGLASVRSPAPPDRSGPALPSSP